MTGTNGPWSRESLGSFLTGAVTSTTAGSRHWQTQHGKEVSSSNGKYRQTDLVPNQAPQGKGRGSLQDFTERVVYTRRIAKVVKGGRRLRFNALVVVGDSDGNVGAGMGKALVIPDAVRKGNAIARRNMVKIPIKGSTIPHEMTVKVGASIVVLKPALRRVPESLLPAPCAQSWNWEACGT